MGTFTFLEGDTLVFQQLEHNIYGNIRNMWKYKKYVEIYENHINIKYQSTQFLNPGSYLVILSLFTFGSCRILKKGRHYFALTGNETELSLKSTFEQNRTETEDQF